MATFHCDTALRFINPEYQPPASRRLREVFDPATLARVGQIGLGDEVDVQAAVDAANAAQKEWRKIDPKSRAARLHQLANTIEQSTERNREVARLMTLEMGKPSVARQRRAVRSLVDRVPGDIVDVCAGRDADPAHLGGQRV